jgi:hypothetical protein
MTTLMYATASENAEIMKLLLDAGADATIQQNSSNGRTALRIANEFRFADGIRLLEERQAAASASPLAAVASVVAPAAPADHETMNKELLTAARRGELAKVKELLAAGANVNAQDEENSLTVIMYAVAAEKLDVVQELLLRGADLTMVNHSRATALHIAAHSHNTEILGEIIGALLAERENLNAQDDHGRTALHQAAEGGYEHAIELLLRKGADPTILDDDMHTAADLADPGLQQLFPGRADPAPAAPPVVRELPAYLPDPEPIVFEVMKIQYKNQKVYDFEENEEMPILSLLSKSWSIIFKAKESYFTLPLDTISKGVKDGSQVRHKCNKELDGAPYERDVDMVRRYYYVQGNGNFLVWLHELEQGLLQDFRIYDLEETEEELANVASAQNVQKTPGKNRYGNSINIVSGDHCQKGTKQKVFKLTPVVFTDEAQPPAPSSGEKRRRVEEDQSQASQAADILRGMRTGARRRTWKRKGKGRKTRKSRK